VPVKYGSDYKLAREIFGKIADEITGGYTIAARDAWKEMVNKYLVEDARVDPMIFLSANDNWMEFTVRYVVDYKKRRITKDLLFTRILEEIDKTDGRVSIASTTLQIVDPPVFDVRITDKSST
jgi:hypothetical protein